MSRPLRIATWVLVGLFVLLRWELLQTYSPSNGFDSHGHIDYLNVVFHGVIPRPNQLWQGYHAPLFYIITAKVAHLLDWQPIPTGQMVTALCSLLVAFGPGYLLARRLLAGWEPLVVLSLLMIPSSVNTSAMVYSQQLATLCGGLFLVLLLHAWQDDKIRIVRELALGIIWAVAIMARYDGFYLGLALGALWLMRIYRRRDQWLAASLAILMTSLLAFAIISPTMLKNIADFNQPVIRNRDGRVYPYSLIRDGVLPNFFNPHCLFDPGLDLWLNPKATNVEAVPVLIFMKLWGANHTNSLPAHLILVLALSLSTLVVLGIGQTWRDENWWPVYAVAIANTVLMAIFLSREPDFSGYKMLYFHGSYYLIGLSLTAGARRVYLNARRPNLAVSACCLLPMAIYAFGYLHYWRPR